MCVCSADADDHLTSCRVLTQQYFEWFFYIFYFSFLLSSPTRRIHDWRCENRKKCQFFYVVLLFIENSWNLSISLWFMFLLIWFLRRLATRDICQWKRTRWKTRKIIALTFCFILRDLLWHSEFRELELISTSTDVTKGSLDLMILWVFA